MMREAAEVLDSARQPRRRPAPRRHRPGQRRRDGLRRPGRGAHHLRARPATRACARCSRRSGRREPPGAAPGCSRCCRARRAAPSRRASLEDDGAVIGARSCDAEALRTAVGKIAVHGSTRLPDGRAVVVEQVEVPADGDHLRRRARGPRRRAGRPRRRLRGHGDRRPRGVRRSAPASPAPRSSSVRSTTRSSALGVDDATYVVIVTRGHTHDIDVLVQALRTPARYIGLMASRRKRAKIVEALSEAGFGDGRASRACTHPSGWTSAPRRRRSSPSASSPS